MVPDDIGAALDKVGARLDEWKQQREFIAAQIEEIVNRATRMLKELDNTNVTGRRVERIAVIKPHEKKRRLSAAAKARISHAQKKRWAAWRKAKTG